VYVPAVGMTEPGYDEDIGYPIVAVHPMKLFGQPGHPERYTGISVNPVDGHGALYGFVKEADAQRYAKAAGSKVISFTLEAMEDFAFAGKVWDGITTPKTAWVKNPPGPRGGDRGGYRQEWYWNGQEWWKAPRKGPMEEFMGGGHVLLQPQDLRMTWEGFQKLLADRHVDGGHEREAHLWTSLGYEGQGFGPEKFLTKERFSRIVQLINQAHLRFPDSPHSLTWDDDPASWETDRGAGRRQRRGGESGIPPKIIDRYQKLRAHAQRGVEHERDVARGKMQELEAEYPGLRKIGSHPEPSRHQQPPKQSTRAATKGPVASDTKRSYMDIGEEAAEDYMQMQEDWRERFSRHDRYEPDSDETAQNMKWFCAALADQGATEAEAAHQFRLVFEGASYAPDDVIKRLARR